MHINNLKFATSYILKKLKETDELILIIYFIIFNIKILY